MVSLARSKLVFKASSVTENCRKNTSYDVVIMLKVFLLLDTCSIYSVISMSVISSNKPIAPSVSNGFGC